MRYSNLLLMQEHSLVRSSCEEYMNETPESPCRRRRSSTRASIERETEVASYLSSPERDSTVEGEKVKQAGDTRLASIY